MHFVEVHDPIFPWDFYPWLGTHVMPSALFSIKPCLSLKINERHQLASLPNVKVHLIFGTEKNLFMTTVKGDGQIHKKVELK